jgi:hypothetical protein
MNPTIEQLARECALQIISQSIADMELVGPPYGEDKATQEVLRFLSACHAGPLKGVEKALESVAKFIEAYDKMPVKMHDEFYGIHTGTEWEASLRLSELRKASKALALLQSIQQPK